MAARTVAGAYSRYWEPYLAISLVYLVMTGVITLAARRLETSVQRVFERGIAYNIGRDYLGGTFRVQPNALLTLQATTLANR